MLFVTNQRPIEGPRPAAGRRLSFDLCADEPAPGVCFAERVAPHAYAELTAKNFFKRIAASAGGRRTLLVIGAGGGGAEPACRAAALAGRALGGGVRPVPVVWALGSRGAMGGAWDAGDAVLAGGLAFGRALRMLDAHAGADGGACGPIDALALGGGAGLLARAAAAHRARLGNVFLVAPDLAADALEPSGAAAALVAAAERVVVYYGLGHGPGQGPGHGEGHGAGADRLGRGGPADIDLTPGHVAAIACSGIERGIGPSLAPPEAVLAHAAAVMERNAVPKIRSYQRRAALTADAHNLCGA